MVQEYSRALDLITDSLGQLSYHFSFWARSSKLTSADDGDLDDDVREAIETSARFLYGLIHARYIVTSRGLGKMVRPHTILQ